MIWRIDIVSSACRNGLPRLSSFDSSWQSRQVRLERLAMRLSTEFSGAQTLLTFFEHLPPLEVDVLLHNLQQC